MDVTRAAEIVAIMLSPTLVVAVALFLPRAGRAVARAVRRRWFTPPAPTSPPIETLAVDLRRLLRQHEATRRSTHLARRAQHLWAIERAIADCAADAARALRVAGSADVSGDAETTKFRQPGGTAAPDTTARDTVARDAAPKTTAHGTAAHGTAAHGTAAHGTAARGTTSMHAASAGAPKQARPPTTAELRELLRRLADAGLVLPEIAAEPPAVASSARRPGHPSIGLIVADHRL